MASVDKKVIVVGVRWPPETFLEQLFEGLRGRDWQVSIASSVRPISRRGTIFRWLRLPPPKPRFLRWFWTATALVGATKRLGPKVLPILRSVNFRSWPQVLPLAGRRGLFYFPWIASAANLLRFLDGNTRYVVSCRGEQIQVAPLMPHRIQLKEALPEIFAGASAVHCVSQAMRREAQGLGLDQDQGTIVFPAVNTSVFRRTRENTATVPTVLSVGSLTWRKGFEYSLLTIARVLTEFPNLQYRVIGDGPELERVRFTIADLGLEKHVRLLGFRDRDQILEALHDTDVFLHTSLSEGIANSVLEAMAMELPVVCSTVGGMSEAIRSGTDGILVDPRNPEDTATAVARLLSDRGLATEIGGSARARVVRDFDLDQQIAAMDRLFSGALS